MKEEQQGLDNYITDKEIVVIGKRVFTKGNLWGQSIVCAITSIDKVAAATTVTQLISQFNVTEVILTGVAGAVDAELRVWDVVLANELIQHDMSVFPLFPKFFIPSSKKCRFFTDKNLNDRLIKAINNFFKNDYHQKINFEIKNQFNLHEVKMQLGLIVSGDQFISDNNIKSPLKEELPELMSIEMESAAIAQVCDDYDLPFAVIRTISDSANENAGGDFQAFIENIASQYTLGILKQYFLIKNEKFD
jgi:adenosylhomocysteine nucleosidase